MNAAPPRVQALLEQALRNAWQFDDLPWNLEVDPEREGVPAASFFTQWLKPFRRMNKRQRRAFVFREACFHLSNLLAGERCGETLVAQVMALTARDRPGDREFLALMAQEEAKHFISLHRYLSQKAGVLYPACRRLRDSLEAVEQCASAELKLLIGQVVLEWTAASLLSSLLTQTREPLLAAVLRLNLRDEARHLAYSQSLREPLSRAFASGIAREMEDLVFESVRASVAALLAEPVWCELGLDARRMRRHALEQLERLGVLDRYRKMVPLQLSRCGFPVEKLNRRLERDLVRGLMDDG